MYFLLAAKDWISVLAPSRSCHPNSLASEKKKRSRVYARSCLAETLDPYEHRLGAADPR